MPRRRRSALRAIHRVREDVNSARGTDGASGNLIPADLSTRVEARSDMILSALAKMADAIAKAAHSRREALRDEGNLQKHQQRVALGKLEKTQEKLDSMKAELKVWEDRVAQTNSFHNRARALWQGSIPNELEEGEIHSEGGRITSGNTETQLCKDVVSVIEDNTSFLNDRVKELKQDISAQQIVVSMADANYNETTAKSKETTRWVKADIEQIDALIKFLRSRDMYMRS